jgi:hypothetical protein
MSDEEIIPPKPRKTKSKRPQPGTALVKPAEKAAPLSGYNRPMSAKQRIKEALLDDFSTVWKEKGIKALRIVAQKDPSTFVRVAAQLLPRDVLVDAQGAGLVVVSLSKEDMAL